MQYFALLNILVLLYHMDPIFSLTWIALKRGNKLYFLLIVRIYSWMTNDIIELHIKITYVSIIFFMSQVIHKEINYYIPIFLSRVGHFFRKWGTHIKRLSLFEFKYFSLVSEQSKVTIWIEIWCIQHYRWIWNTWYTFCTQ